MPATFGKKFFVTHALERKCSHFNALDLFFLVTLVFVLFRHPIRSAKIYVNNYNAQSYNRRLVFFYLKETVSRDLRLLFFS
jgi:hypothetical protein